MKIIIGEQYRLKNGRVVEIHSAERKWDNYRPTDGYLVEWNDRIFFVTGDEIAEPYNVDQTELF